MQPYILFLLHKNQKEDAIIRVTGKKRSSQINLDRPPGMTNLKNQKVGTDEEFNIYVVDILRDL